MIWWVGLFFVFRVYIIMLKFVKILCNVLLMDGLFNNAVISNNLTVSGNIECDSINIQSGTLSGITSLNGLTPQNLQTLDTTTSLSYQLSNLNTNLTSYIDTQINNLLYNSDLSLNSIVELSNAIANDQNFAVNMASSIASKISKSDNNQTIPANNLNFSGTNTLINDLYVNDTIMILDNSNNSVTNLKQKLDTIDTNIANVIATNSAKNNQQDLSMNNIIGDINMLSNRVDISLNSLISKDSQIDLSLNGIIDDINLLTNRVDLSLNSLINKDTQIDASLNSLIAKDTQIDASLNAIITKNNQQDTSLNNIRTNFRDEVLNASSDKFGFYTADNTELLVYDKPSNTLQLNGNLINTNSVNNTIGLNGKLVSDHQVFINNTLDVDDISTNSVVINGNNVTTELNDIKTDISGLMTSFADETVTNNVGIYKGGYPLYTFSHTNNRLEIFDGEMSIDTNNNLSIINTDLRVNSDVEISGNLMVTDNGTYKNLITEINNIKSLISDMNVLYSSLQSNTIKASGSWYSTLNGNTGGLIKGGEYIEEIVRNSTVNTRTGVMLVLKNTVQNIRGIVLATAETNGYVCVTNFFNNAGTPNNYFNKAIHIVTIDGGSNPIVVQNTNFYWAVI